jgi:hypothetical protein
MPLARYLYRLRRATVNSALLEYFKQRPEALRLNWDDAATIQAIAVDPHVSRVGCSLGQLRQHASALDYHFGTQLAEKALSGGRSVMVGFFPRTAEARSGYEGCCLVVASGCGCMASSL